MPAAEAGLQREMLVMQPAERSPESKEVSLATMQRHVGSAFFASSAVKTSQIRNLNGANGMSDMAGNAASVAVESGGRCRDTNQKSYIRHPVQNKDD
jgi:hypothetical protein